MKILWEDRAWKDYLAWQEQDRKTLKRVNKLIAEIQREPLGGIGKAEPLKGNLSGCFSRRIDETNRVVYFIRDDIVHIIACKGHYDDK